ncbi:MAG: CBS domain-containing protein [Bacteroidetes bacterium]|nr:CBS domain-containing protein [Bacteroidota bacterium]
MIIPLLISDNGEIALNRMDEFNVTHLPVLDDNTLIGLITDTDIFNSNEFSLLLGQYTFSLGLVYVTQYQHIYDVIKLFDTHQLTLLPVLDDKRHYLGSITLPKLVNQFSILSAAKIPGAIIILELNTSDYLMTQIAQIIESNEAKILSLCTTTYNDSTRMEITLKINKVEIRSILQTFNRYNYIVKASFTEEDVYEDLRERYDSFMRYLNT